MNLASTTRYCVTVDTEEEWDWASGYPTGPATVTNIARLPDFQALCERHGAAVVYFVNHAVLADPTATQVIQELAARPNVEIGLHIHPWNTPPLASTPSVPVRESFLHNLPWEVAKAKLDATLAAFTAAGLSPTSFRGGRYSTSPQIQHHLRERGVLADASVLPFTTWVDEGAPDFRDRDPLPVRRLTPAGAMWEVPLTFGYTRRPFRKWHGLLTAAGKGVWKPLRAVGILDRLGVVRKAWLNLENPAYPNPAAFVPVVAAEGLPFTCFTLHSSSLLPGGSPYCRTATDVARLLARTEQSLAAAAAAGWRPATITDTAKELEVNFGRQSHLKSGTP
ncbi:MAG: hypothetical protein MUF18_06420 [Fimbriiglobus sp.]|jgi:hypothetical protein|nr:hypothetical protein [Fimbriiglobus sp.]